MVEPRLERVQQPLPVGRGQRVQRLEPRGDECPRDVLVGEHQDRREVVSGARGMLGGQGPARHQRERHARPAQRRVGLAGRDRRAKRRVGGRDGARDAASLPGPVRIGDHDEGALPIRARERLDAEPAGNGPGLISGQSQHGERRGQPPTGELRGTRDRLGVVTLFVEQQRGQPAAPALALGGLV